MQFLLNLFAFMLVLLSKRLVIGDQ
jgi:hypothetical protein